MKSVEDTTENGERGNRPVRVVCGTPVVADRRGLSSGIECLDVVKLCRVVMPDPVPRAGSDPRFSCANQPLPIHKLGARDLLSLTCSTAKQQQKKKVGNQRRAVFAGESFVPFFCIFFLSSSDSHEHPPRAILDPTGEERHVGRVFGLVGLFGEEERSFR